MQDDPKTSSVTAFYGGASEIAHQVRELTNGKAILLIPPQGLTESSAIALQDLLQETAQLFLNETLDNIRKRREVLISALMPSIPAGELKQAGMEARSRAAALAACEWLTAKDVAERAGFSAANASSTPWKWKQEGSIFAINNEGKDLYPIYGLDPGSGYRPLKSLKPIRETFKGHKGSWGVAYWFASANSFLGGKRPMDLLKSEQDRVLEAAGDETMGAVHG